MQQRNKRRTAAWVATLAAVAFSLPLAVIETDASAAPQAGAPKALGKYTSPLSEARTKQLVAAGKAKYGPGKQKLPQFKVTDAKQRAAAIKGISNVLAIAKKDPKATAQIKDSVKLWEAMTPIQKNAVLEDYDAVVAAAPALGVVEVAAAVVAAVAVADFVYKVYVDQREEAEEDAKEDAADAAGDAADGGDGGDTGTDAGVIVGALGY
jgi:hypothetical protein